MSKAPRLYIPRSVDGQLSKLADWWLQGDSRAHWVTLSSVPGRGNTWLLEQFLASLQKQRAFRKRFCAVLVTGSRPGSIPRALSPVTQAVRDLYSTSRLSHLHRLGRRFHQASAWQLAGVALILLAGTALACLLVGFDEYIKSQDVRQRAFVTSLSGFFSTYLLANWQAFPIWLLTASIIVVPFSVAVFLIRALLLREASPPRVTEDELKFFEKSEGLSEAIAHLCRGLQGLVILIDNARWLPFEDIAFLNSLLVPDDDVAPESPWRPGRLLVIALDWQGSGQRPLFDVSAKLRAQVIPVTPFDLIQLRSIFLTQLEEHERSGHDEDEVLREANGNVRPILAIRDRKLTAEVGWDFTAVRDASSGRAFGLADLMVYQVVREPTSVDRDELETWLASDQLEAHLREFRVRPIEKGNVPSLVEKFGGCSLVRQTGRVSHLDSARSAALENWLEINEPLLLGRAHYFWFGYCRRQAGAPINPMAAAALSSDQRHSLQQAAWHAETLVTGTGGGDVLGQASGLATEERRRCKREIVEVLVIGAALWRDEGDCQTSIELLQAALLAIEATEGADDLAAAVLDQLWRSWWLCGDPVLRDEIREVTKRWSTAGPAAAHERFEELLKGTAALPAPIASSALGDPFLLNLHSLTELTWKLRQEHGFVLTGLADTEAEIPEPLAAPASRAEFHLRYYRCLNTLKRRDFAGFQQTLGAWRDRLRDLEPTLGARLGDEVFGRLELARYHHLLVVAAAATVQSPVASLERPKLALAETLAAALLNPEEADGEVGSWAWLEARRAYEQTIRLAALLRWRVLLLEATFGLATLLRLRAAAEPPDTGGEEWDGLLSRCIEHEKALGWTFYQPEIHRTRFEVFHEISSELSVEDAYNTWLAMRTAQYPVRIILEWHQKVSSLLNDYHNSDDDWRRSASLHVTWARELAILPEAAGLRRFTSLEHEQAEALHFAAQAMRNLEEVEKAEELLDEAEGLLSSAPPAPNEHEATMVRELTLKLRLQRAWVFRSQERLQEHAEAIHGIWREARRGDSNIALVLGSLAAIEAREGHLESPWPAPPETDPAKDPANSHLSLPRSWFAGGATSPATLIEFRVYQLRSLLWSPSSAVDFPAECAAQWNWGGINRFGETWLRLAHLAAERDLSPATLRLMRQGLDAVRWYFAKIAKVDSKELEALRLLMQYAPDPSYRAEYTTALAEYEYLLKRELQVSSERPDWMALASRVHDYLGLLEDSDLVSRRLYEVADVKSIEGLLRRRDKQRDALPRARAAFNKRDVNGCRDMLEKLLPASDLPWVFLEDLHVLDLWLRCAVRLEDGEDFTARANQLRQLSLRFIKQFSETISEPQIQRLALELLETASQAGRMTAPPPATVVAAREASQARRMPHLRSPSPQPA